MNFIFEKLALNDLMDMLSLKFENPKRAIKYVTSHLFAIKINSHTGVALGHSLVSDLEIEECLNFLAETTLCYCWLDANQIDLADKLEKQGFRFNLAVTLMKADLQRIETYEPPL